MGANHFMQSPCWIIAPHSIASIYRTWYSIALPNLTLLTISGIGMSSSIAYSSWHFHSCLPRPARIKSCFLESSGVPETSRILGQGLMTVAAVVHGMAVLRCIEGAVMFGDGQVRCREMPPKPPLLPLPRRASHENVTNMSRTSGGMGNRVVPPLKALCQDRALPPPPPLSIPLSFDRRSSRVWDWDAW